MIPGIIIVLVEELPILHTAIIGRIMHVDHLHHGDIIFCDIHNQKTKNNLQESRSLQVEQLPIPFDRIPIERLLFTIPEPVVLLVSHHDLGPIRPQLTRRKEVVPYVHGHAHCYPTGFT